MKLRYESLKHSEVGLTRFQIYEMLPSFRTLQVHKLPHQFRGAHLYKRLPLPHVLFCLRSISEGHRVRNWGLNGKSLQVLWATESPTSLKSEVYFSPFDIHRNGAICTDHQFDGIVFASNREFVNFAVDFWFGTQHGIQQHYTGHRVYGNQCIAEGLVDDEHSYNINSLPEDDFRQWKLIPAGSIEEALGHAMNWHFASPLPIDLTKKDFL